LPTQTGAPEVHFLSIQNVLGNPMPAATILKLIKEPLKDDLNINKLSSLTSDGENAMTASRNGVADEGISPNSY